MQDAGAAGQQGKDDSMLGRWSGWAGGTKSSRCVQGETGEVAGRVGEQGEHGLLVELIGDGCHRHSAARCGWRWNLMARRRTNTSRGSLRLMEADEVRGCRGGKAACLQAVEAKQRKEGARARCGKGQEEAMGIRHWYEGLLPCGGARGRGSREWGRAERGARV